MSYSTLVIKEHISSYPDPVLIKKDETAIISHCDLEWRGWVWIILPGGKAGWAPQQIFCPFSSNEVICLEDYTAHELTVSPDEKLELIRSINGWYWAKKNSGEFGWIPQECISLPGVKPGLFHFTDDSFP
uniref:SH3 domain-containing protein n=1 Tax=Scandinavium goeteborgense TaxID=1851514 RepID=UPI001358D123|nr:SH3 domain-containing protein [Scandinavium goeteborgense]